MLPTIKKILYATDLSENSQLAFGYAASLAIRFDAEMMVLHVDEPISTNTYVQLSGMMGEAEWVNLQRDYGDRLSDEIVSKLKQFCEEMQASLVTIKLRDEHVFIRKGEPVEEILALAAEQGVDIIIMGTHGYGMVKDALMGGTARRIVRRSDTPVLVVRNPEMSP